MGQIVSQIKSIFVDEEEVSPTTQTPPNNNQQQGQQQSRPKATNSNWACSNPKSVTHFVSTKWIGSYNNKHRILLVGEGDFSFSASLAVAFGSATNIVATSLDPRGFLIRNYGMFETNKRELVTRGGIVIHEFNARTMVKDSVLGKFKFDHIIFNFPRVGTFGQTDSDMRLHKDLVREFLRNAKKMIHEDGEIHIRHKTSGFFLQWNIPKIGSDQGLTLIQEVQFSPDSYPGYHTKYGFGGDKDFQCTPCNTYKFGLPLLPY